MGQFDGIGDFPATDSFINLKQLSSPLSSDFDAVSNQNDFLDQMFSSLPPFDNYPALIDEQPDMKPLMFPQQFGITGSVPENDGMVSLPYPNLTNDASVNALFTGFEESLPQNSIPSSNFNHFQGGVQQGALQSQNYSTTGSSSGVLASQPRQRVRARRGQATDPHSIAERLRRERIAERMKALQELVPNANKTDKASMLDEIIDYVKFLQLQVKVLSVSRLGGAAAAITTSVSDHSHESNESTEQQVAKLMEEDMGAAMQYLQGKGLCLMPISAASNVSASQRTSFLLNGKAASSTVGEVEGSN